MQQEKSLDYFRGVIVMDEVYFPGKTVLRVILNNGRYFFDYDELTGDFAMEIRPVQVEEDAGVWQCHVTVYQKGNTHTLTSRSRVRVPHGVRFTTLP